MREMGSVFHLLCLRYSGTLTPLPLRLLGKGKSLPLPIKEINWMSVCAHAGQLYAFSYIHPFSRLWKCDVCRLGSSGYRSLGDSI